MSAFDAERERRAEAQTLGNHSMQLADFQRPRRRFILGALLAWPGRLWRIQLPPLLPPPRNAQPRP